MSTRIGFPLVRPASATSDGRSRHHGGKTPRPGTETQTEKPDEVADAPPLSPANQVDKLV